MAESKGDPKVRALLKAALAVGAVLIVPPIVVTETFRGDERDVLLNALLKRVVVPEVDRTFAETAGRLLARSGGSNAPDAQVAAEALRRAPCTLLTSDPIDMQVLLDGIDTTLGIEILDVGKLDAKRQR